MAAGNLETWRVSEPYLNLHCLLGEGPYYERASNTFRFVDIRKKHVHTFSLDGGPASLTTVQLDEPVGVTADIEGLNPQEKILVGLKYGIAILDRKTGKYEYVTRYKDGDGDVRLRSNDGAVDPHGRFWLGTMTDFGHGDFSPEGFLIRFDRGKSSEVVRPDLTIPNSVGWSPDGKTMFFTHTTTNTIYAWDYSPADGGLSNERVFFQHAGPGWLDGFRVDVDGNLWHAVWGGARVLKISPDARVVGEVHLPTKYITCPQFVGTELFITSAADEWGESGPVSVEYGGGLFRVDVGTTGLKPYNFKLDT